MKHILSKREKRKVSIRNGLIREEKRLLMAYSKIEKKKHGYSWVEFLFNKKVS